MIETRFNVLRGNDRRASLTGNLNTAVQERLMEPLAEMEGEITGANINHDATVDGRWHRSSSLKQVSSEKQAKKRNAGI